MLVIGLLFSQFLPFILGDVTVIQEFTASRKVHLRYERSFDVLPQSFELFPRSPRVMTAHFNDFTTSFNFSVQLFTRSNDGSVAPLGNKVYRTIKFSGVNEPWINDTFTTESGVSLSVSTKMVCKENSRGSRCEHYCDERLAKASRKRCDAMGRLRCDIGWMGPHCGKAVDPRKCNCQNDGICTSSYIHNTTLGNPVEEKLICECPKGYAGAQCDIPEFTQFQYVAPAQKTNSCSAKDACLNGAKCFPNGPRVFCACPVGFIGEFCEVSLTTTTPSVSISVKTSGYSITAYSFVGVMTVLLLLLGFCTYKLKPLRRHALSRGQDPAPFPMPETNKMLIDPEAAIAAKKVFTIEENVKEVDGEDRYTLGPTIRSFANNDYAVIQKPPPPTLNLPSIPSIHYV